MSYLYRTITALLALALVLPLAGIADAQGQTPAEICTEATKDIPEPDTREFSEAEQVLKEGVDYQAVLCTVQGAIYVDLFEADAPMTVNNFVFLAGQNYYNNTTFHRVLPGFMAQGGDPTGTGSGGPGYEFGDETDNGKTFEIPGLLAMANAGPGTNGSQFFITTAPTTWLDGNHTIFGAVIQGIDVTELLTPRDPEQLPEFEGDTLQTVVIIEDPAAVNTTPDTAPTLQHIQTLLEKSIGGQINTQFTPIEEESQLRSLEQESLGSEALGTLLDEAGFAGSANLVMRGECPANPEDSPIWGVGFHVSEFASAEAAQSVASSDERSNQLVEAGEYESFEDPADLIGRFYMHPVTDWCGENGMWYTYEQVVGRYIVAIDEVIDGSIINASTQPMPSQLAAYVMDSLLLGTVRSTLDRGSAAE